MFSRDLPIVAPEAVGIDKDRLHRALEVLRSGIGKAFPGATVCALRKNKCFLDVAFGTHGGNTPARLETLYDLASLTKPMATAASVLVLVERGDLTLTATLGDLLGDAAGAWKAITVRQLVTHTSGLPAWIACYKNDTGLEKAIQAILSVSPTGRPKPGSAYEYSCLNYIMLGYIVEQVSGRSLSQFARTNLYAPLGLNDVLFLPDNSVQRRIAPTVSHEGPETTFPVTLCGAVHDGNARGIGGIAGNAGLFGTARDVARFGTALLHPEGENRLFSQPTRARIWENQIPGIGGQTLMFFADGNGMNPVGDLLSPRAVGHSGYTGTLLALDPEYDLAVAVLTNSVYLPDPAAKTNWLSLRRRFLNVLASALQ